MKRLKLSIYYVRQNFALFRKLVALTLGYNCVKGHRASKTVKQIGLKRLGGKLEAKNCFQIKSWTKYLKQTLVFL